MAAVGASVVLVGTPAERKLSGKVLSAMKEPAVDLTGELGLGALKAVVRRSRVLICNDAGARHIAAAFGVPTLVLVGPVSISYTNLNLRRTRLLREDVECSPCQLKVCPIDHRCMTRLRPSRVLAEAKAALSDPAWEGSRELELEE